MLPMSPTLGKDAYRCSLHGTMQIISHGFAYRACYSFTVTPIPFCTATSSPPTCLLTSTGGSRSQTSISAVWSCHTRALTITALLLLPILDGLHLRSNPARLHSLTVTIMCGYTAHALTLLSYDGCAYFPADLSGALRRLQPLTAFVTY